MWTENVACTPEQHSLFFSELKSKVAKAKAICATCPVTAQCLDLAIRNGDEFGIFGGLTPAERKSLVSN